MTASRCEDVGSEEERCIDTGKLLENHETDGHQQRLDSPPLENLGELNVFRLVRSYGSSELRYLVIWVVSVAPEPSQC